MIDQKTKHIVRIFATDLVGAKPIGHALTKVKGISFAMSNAICTISGVDKFKQTGLLNDVEIKKIEDTMQDLNKFPKWMLNRQDDFDEGKDSHLMNVNLKLRTEFDIKRLQKIKSYRGMRHSAGLPVRGQRTKGHFRGKGKTLGVKRKKK